MLLRTPYTVTTKTRRRAATNMYARLTSLAIQGHNGEVGIASRADRHRTLFLFRRYGKSVAARSCWAITYNKRDQSVPTGIAPLWPLSRTKGLPVVPRRQRVESMTWTGAGTGSRPTRCGHCSGLLATLAEMNRTHRGMFGRLASKCIACGKAPGFRLWHFEDDLLCWPCPGTCRAYRPQSGGRDCRLPHVLLP